MNRCFNRSETITASEIAQYAYCPVSWYLKRCGCQPQSPGLAAGIEKHQKAGDRISTLQKRETASRRLRLLGHISLLAAFLLLAWWIL